MMALTETQRTALVEPLDPKLGKFRKGDKGRDVSYLEGYQVIVQANTILGYDAWGYSVDRIDTTMMPNGKGMIYWALVTVTVDGCGMRQDVGCHVIRNTTDADGKEKDNVNNPDQHDLARKSCVTDALKRAFRTYGEQFGNSLYDKDSDIHDAIHAAVAQEQQQKRQVAAPRRNPPAQTAQQQRPPAPRPTPPPARTAATPAGGATTPRQERPANIRDLAAAIPDTRTLAREETQVRAADGQVVMERRRDGTVALNNVPLGEDGTAMFEALRKAMTLDALGKEWTAVVANRTALSAPQLDILIRWKENRKVELEQPGVAL